ncbi:MAG: peptidase U32 family protein [Candidatus Thorarchaeota archaeon]
MIKKIPELLSPAGSLDKARYALDFGADAIYCGTNIFALRTYRDNFDMKELEKIVEYAHQNEKSVYVALNIFAHNNHLNIIKKAFKKLKEIKPDAFIISDPGIFSLSKKLVPQVPIHISTQANTLNIESVKFWKKQGAERIILARECSLKEIGEIHRKVKNIELETFIHGSQCMAYSGRCMLTAALGNQGRSNIGTCKNACRWQYRELEEFKRPGIKVPVKEDLQGTYFFNANDMCMIEYLSELIKAGIASFKIEGRGRSEFYVAQVTKAYRQALDLIKNNSKDYKKEVKKLKSKLEKSNQREFDEGFFFAAPRQTTTHGKMDPSYIFAGKLIEKIDDYTGRFSIVNEIYRGEKVNILTPDNEYEMKIDKLIKAGSKKEVESVHGGNKDEIILKLPKKIQERTIIWLDKGRRDKKLKG